MWIDEFRAQVEARPNARALVTDRGTLSYQELWYRAAAWAAQAGPGGGRRMIVDDHAASTLVATLGCWLAGLVPVVVHRSLPPETIRQLEPRLARPAPPPRSPDPESQEGIVLATSGTTGLPKLVVLPHGAAAWNARALRPWFGLEPGAGLLAVSSFSIAATLLTSTLVGLADGWTVHALPEGTPMPRLHGYMRGNPIAAITCASSFFRLFLAYGNGEPFLSLRRVTCGGETTSPALLKDLTRVFPNARVSISYGATETGTRISNIEAGEPGLEEGSVGHPLPHMEWRVRSVPGVDAPAGELLVRGPSVCLGYLGAEGQYEGLDSQGWYPTRDLVRPGPDGALLHLGRADALVKMGGFLVNPMEVEHLLRRMAGVSEARCFATPHPVLGTVLGAEVVPQPGVRLDPTALLAQCRQHLEVYKLPKSIEVVVALPTTSGGKVARAISPVR